MKMGYIATLTEFSGVQWGESLLKTNGILCESFQIGD